MLTGAAWSISNMQGSPLAINEINPFSSAGHNCIPQRFEGVIATGFEAVVGIFE